MDRVRVLRLVEYIGDREWVENTIAGSIKGTLILAEDKMIRAATIGDFPEILGTFGSPMVETMEQREKRKEAERLLRKEKPNNDLVG